MIDLSVFAATQNGTVITGGLCEHHTEHTAECGYEEAVEGSSCTYTCSECSQTDAEKEIEAGQPEEADCTCGTDDDAIHATDCPKYTVPENPMCTCVEKCTGDNVNVWCDVCGVQGAEACESKGDEEAVTFEEVANITYLSCDENGQNWEVATCESATVVSSENTTWTSGWYVLNSDVSFSVSDEITVSGTVNLILADGYILTVRNGINVSEGNSLTIYAQSTGDNMGNLYVTGGNVVAGIGGRKGKNGGAITINGGTVTATGNGGGAGGDDGVGGVGGAGGTIEITGGIVSATAGTNAEHIGEGAEATSEGTVSYADCLVFEGGSDGKVYGDFILDTNFTLENSKSITVPNTATLTVAENVTLTNEGTITYEAPVSGTGYTIDYKNEKIVIEDTYEASTAAVFGSDTMFTETPLLDDDFGNTVSKGYIRVAEPSGIVGNGTINREVGTLSVSIPSRPTLSLSIDNSAEGVVLSDDYYYNFTSNAYDSEEWTQGSGNVVTVEPKTNIYIYKVATEETFKSAVQTLPAPARRTDVASLKLVKDYPNVASDGRIVNVTTEMEYRL